MLQRSPSNNARRRLSIPLQNMFKRLLGRPIRDSCKPGNKHIYGHQWIVLRLRWLGVLLLSICLAVPASPFELLRLSNRCQYHLNVGSESQATQRNFHLLRWWWGACQLLEWLRQLHVQCDHLNRREYLPSWRYIFEQHLRLIPIRPRLQRKWQ